MSILCAYLMVRTLERSNPSILLFAIEVCALIVCVSITDMYYPRGLELPSTTADQERSEES
jgi:hypothetical protein